MRSMRTETGVWATVLATVALPFFLAAGTVAESSSAVERWSARGSRLGLPRGRRVIRVVPHSIGGTAPAFHETRFEGGGFALTDATDPDGRVIAFSADGALSEDPRSPLWALVRKHMMLKAILGAEASAPVSPVSAVSDLRVAPLVQSRWDQATAGGGYCYNYYTPRHYYCGCTATAMSQIMRYHEWPALPSAVETNECYVAGVATNLAMKGGPYAWNMMPCRPETGAAEENREAIGRLTYDCGVAMHTAYSSGGSGASGTPVHLRFREVFGYASAHAVYANLGETLDGGTLRNAVLANLDAKCPVLFGIFNYYSGGYHDGHAIVADGYGYADGVLYVHLNMGWSGTDDAWYALPDINAKSAGYYFNLIDTAVYNIFPEGNGAVVSGHVTQDGTNVAERAVSVYRADGGLEQTVVTDTNGVYAAVLPESATYRLVVTAGDGRAVTNEVTAGFNASATDYDWDTDMYTYDSIKGIVCGNRWGRDIDLSEKVRIERSVPEAGRVSVRVGAEQPFSVVVHAPGKAEVTYRWLLDEVAIEDANAAEFLFVPTFADRGTRTLVCEATVGEVVLRRTWTVAVCGDLYVSASSGSDETGTGEDTFPFATINAAIEQALEGDVVKVGQGVYTGAVYAVAARVDVIATDGPEKTVIDANWTGPCYCGEATGTAVLRGFTLQHGRFLCGAGVYCGVVSNCVIRECYAYYDSKYRDSGYGGGAYGSTLYDTYVYWNLADLEGGGICVSAAVRCTIVGNEAGTSGSGADYDSQCEDSIVWDNWNSSGSIDNWSMYRVWQKTYATAFDHSCTYPQPNAGAGNITNDPVFVSLADADFRLRKVSPCIGTASDGGNMGAYRGTGEGGSRISVEIDGPGSVSPMATVLEEGESATFTATEHHPFLGFETNGVFLTTDHEVTLPCPSDDLVLHAYFAHTNFFVDAAKGDDENDGWSWTSAKRSIGAAVDVAVSGERVEVRPGAYGGFECYSDGLEIVAVDGPDVTAIDAAGEGSCFVSYGLSVLSGFTLRNAFAPGCRGGGAYGGTLVGCVISNCTATIGGGVADAVLQGCTLAENAADAQGGGASGCLMTRCTVWGNVARQFRSDYSELAGGGVDCACACTNCVVWGNLNHKGCADNWEAYTYIIGRNAYVTVPWLDYCCTEPWISIGEGHVYADPRFVDAEHGDFRLYEISPCIGAATDGGNIGAYAGAGVKREIPQLPDDPTPEDVARAVEEADFADPQVSEFIGSDSGKYETFRAWSSKLNSTAVVLGLRSYLSFVLRDIVASPYLLSDDGEVRLSIDKIDPMPDELSLTVRLTDGSNPVALTTAKAALADKMRLGETLDSMRPASVDDILVSEAAPDGAVNLQVRPAGTVSSFVDLRVK